MTTRTWAGFFLFGSLLLWASGCSSASDRLKGLSADLSEVKISPTGVTISVRYINETVVPIALSGSRHELQLNGTSIGDVRSDKPVGVQKLSSVTQEIPLTDPKAAERVRQLGGSGQVRYRLQSTLQILAGDDKLTAPSKAEGLVEVRTVDQ